MPLTETRPADTSEDMVYVRNTSKQHCVLSSDPKGTFQVEWAAAGDPAGEDVKVVPREVRRTPGYIRNRQRGRLVEITEDEAMGAIEAQTAAWQAVSDGAATQALATIEHPAQNDMVQMQCIGPDTRGQGPCGVDVVARESVKDQAPPLCPQHAHLAPEYVPTVDTSGEKNVTKWTRATMGPRETQHS